MTALEALSAALDKATLRERRHLDEMAELRAEVARLERHNETLQNALWEQTRLVDELGSVPAKAVAS